MSSMNKQDRILHTAYLLHQEGRPIHRWSIYNHLLDKKCKWVTMDCVSQTLRIHKKELRECGSLPSTGGGVKVYRWVGGDDYFKPLP